MPGALPLLSSTHLGWDFKGEEVEAPGGQGLQRKEKKVSSKWQSFLGIDPSFGPLSLCATSVSNDHLLWGSSLSLMPHPNLSDIHLSSLPLFQAISPQLFPTSVSPASQAFCSQWSSCP